MGDVYPTVRLAAVQAASVYLDREATVDKACFLIDEAAKKGAQVIAFPEGFIPAFPNWFFWYMPRETDSIHFSKELVKNSVVVPGPTTDALGKAARKAGAYVVMGINERDPKARGSLYNSLLFIGPDGDILGVHRKLVPTSTERLIHWGGDGSSVRVYDTPYGGLGGLICGENTNCLARFALLIQHEHIHIAAWPAFVFGQQTSRPGFEGMDIRIRCHAYEGKIFVISVATVLDDQNIKVLGLTDEQVAALGSRGGHSGIVGPSGQFIAGPADDTEQIVYADADMEQIIEGRIVHDLTGHYNRLDVFTLLMRQVPRRGLQIIDEAGDGILLGQTNPAESAATRSVQDD